MTFALVLYGSLTVNCAMGFQCLEFPARSSVLLAGLILEECQFQREVLSEFIFVPGVRVECELETAKERDA